MSDLNSKKITFESGATAWAPSYVGTSLIGDGTNIGAMSHIGKDVVIGTECKIQGSVYISDKTKIGNNVFIGPGAVVTNDKYPPSGGNWSPVTIEDGVVIGGNATIVAGITLSANCVIGAGSVVTKSVPPNEVWAGNPAKFTMKREEYELRRDGNE
tara:strand:- start:1508 stop:1975 length:468 start_codon:yes stop_codon:yes gene_type:complete